MSKFVQLSLVLLLVAGIATGVLALTNQVTAPAIAAGAQREKENALRGIFFNGYAKCEPRASADGGVEYFAVFLDANSREPDFYALTGKGVGYNKSVPIELMVGFANPAKRGVVLPGGEKYTAGRMVCAGWKVVKSQETPGLGENARQERPDFTWWQWLTRHRSPATNDHRTAFQKQFAGREPASLAAKQNIDVITGATYSTVGIINAIKNAAANLEKALAAK